MSVLFHRGEAYQEEEMVVGGLHDLERNLRGLTMGIHNTRMRYITYHLQIHILGVPDNISSLFR